MQFGLQNYTLLYRYTGSKVKMRVQCPKGHIVSLSWSSFQNGHGCIICGHEKQALANSEQVGSKNHRWKPDRNQVLQNKEVYQQQVNMLKSVLRRSGTSKEGHVHAILGYSAQQLLGHLQSFACYTYLCAIGDLAIDHIFPVKAFLEHGIKNPAIICALSNLQPLSKTENSEKHDLYTDEEFQQYCIKHNIKLGGVCAST
jgi:hypothetical protein